MDQVAAVLAIVVGIVAVSALAKRLKVPAPILLVAAGVAVSFAPGVPEIEMDPELVLVVLLPPLLYATAIRSSLVDLHRNIRSIGSLAVGLVLATVAVVGFGLHAVVPSVSLAAAFALGAVVGPSDAVAATAVGRRSGLGRKTLTVLEGESLFNDATALVALQVALLAVAGEVHAAAAVGRFFVVALGGLAVGVAGGLLLTLLRRHIHDTLTDTAMSLAAPFAVFVLAEQLHVSGVLAVVVTGLILAHRSPVDQDPEARLVDDAVWSTATFILEGVIFLLIGLQLRSIVTSVNSDARELIVSSSLVLGAVVLVRPAWVFATTYIGRIAPWSTRGTPPWQQLAVVSWAGMRGVVSLAAALSLPLDIDRRDLLLVLTVVVIIGTLVAQGVTLPWVIRHLGLEPPDPRLDALQRANAQELATRAGIDRLHDLAERERAPREIVERLEQMAEFHAYKAWEQLANDTAFTPTAIYRRLRTEMIRAEREVLVDLRDRGQLDDDVLRTVQRWLDLEDVMLVRVDDDRPERRGLLEDLIPPAPSTCEHLDAAADAPAVRPDELACEDCVALGWEWVHLRQCVACRRIGCCDSSRGRHAHAHYQASRHPVMRSVEPGEAWRWCYVDKVLG